MTDILLIELNLEELCTTLKTTSEVVLEIIDQGIIEPQGNAPESWVFDDKMLALSQRALRLHQDLEIEWAGIALAINLLEEVEFLRADNKRLHRCLDKLLHDEKGYE